MDATTDLVLNCVACKQDFIFDQEQQAFFGSRGYVNQPKRCPPCRSELIGAGQYVPMFPHEGECASVCVCKPLPHAWNLVNGHVVDLLAEFYNWRFGSDYLHEPLKVYTLEDLLRIDGAPDNFSLFQKVWMEEHQDREPESMAAVWQRVFREASDRLVQKVAYSVLMSSNKA